MIIALGTTLIGWLVILFVSTNLVGFFWRSLYEYPQALPRPRTSEDNVAPLITGIKKRPKINVFALGLTIVFISLLYHFWNIGVASVAILLMAGRLPDLHWEIMHDRKLEKFDMNRPRFYRINTVVTWATLPLLWFALYRM
ncbi:MAG: hypothetical protein JWO15_2676 [Sphingomonadales bacterium]|nr:hypothetical protein [Sphingomonadales bacterium]